MMQPRSPVAPLLGALLLAGTLIAASPPTHRDDPPPISYTPVPSIQKGICAVGSGTGPEPSPPTGAAVVANLCAGQGYGEAIKSYLKAISHRRVMVTRNMDAWRRAMARWVPCLIEKLKSPSYRTREEVVKLLDKLRDPRAVDPMLKMLERVPEEGSDAWTARNSLSRTFKARKVVPFLEKAARNPRKLSTGMAGFFGGVRDKRLLEITLNRFEEYDRRYPADGHSAFGFWNELAWQAIVQPGNPRLRSVVMVALDRGERFDLYGILQLTKIICPGQDCSWLRDKVVSRVDEMSGEEARQQYWNLINFLCQEAPEGEDLRFLQRILDTGLGASSPLRGTLSSMLLEKSCRKEGSPATAAELRECMATIESGSLKTVSPRTAVALIEATCGNAASGKADPDCWASFKTLFHGNPAMEASLAINEAGALLLGGEEGFERAGKLLATVDPDETPRICDRHTNWIYAKVRKTYEHLRWKKTNSQAGREVLLEGPVSSAAGAWVFILRGPTEILESLVGVPVLAFAWFSPSGTGEEGRTASVRLLDRGKTWTSWKVNVIPFPEPVPSDHHIHRLQMIFLGKNETQPLLNISWADHARGAHHDS